MSKNITKPKPSLPSVLSQRSVELLQDLEEFFHQLELEGCPAATVARFRKLTQIAAAQILAESRRRAFLLGKVKQSVDKLRPRWMSSDLEGSLGALDDVESFTSQLPYSREQQIVLKRLRQMRKCLEVLP